MSKAFDELCKRLEAERHDISWKNPKPRDFDTVIVTKNVYPKKSERDHREKMFFHAGRAAAGATDKLATEAAQWLESDFGKTMTS